MWRYINCVRSEVSLSEGQSAGVHSLELKRATSWMLIITYAVCLSSCYSDFPDPPPCFQEGVTVEFNAQVPGRWSVSSCCLDVEICQARFELARQSQESGFNSSTLLIQRFAHCEPLDASSTAPFTQLSEEYGTCSMRLDVSNAQCFSSIECGEETPYCCPVEGERCREAFEPAVSSCSLCVPDPCDP